MFLPYVPISYSVTGGAYEYFTNNSRILCVSLLGTLLHFTYRWSGCNPLIGLIAPVNESVWEHMKLLFFPMLPVWTVEPKRGDRCLPHICFSRRTAMGTLLIPVLFYAYTSCWDVTSWYWISPCFLHLCNCGLSHIPRIVRSCRLEKYSHVTSMAVFLLLICFLLFTYFPPGFSIFRDPRG